MDVHSLELEQQATRNSEEHDEAKKGQNGSSYPVSIESKTGKDVVAAVGDARGICSGISSGAVVEPISELVGAKCTEGEMLSW